MQDEQFKTPILIWLFAGILALIIAVGTASALTLSVETKLIVGVALFAATLFSSVAALDICL